DLAARITHQFRPHVEAQPGCVRVEGLDSQAKQLVEGDVFLHHPAQERARFPGFFLRHAGSNSTRTKPGATCAPAEACMALTCTAKGRCRPCSIFIASS